jgi:hypothetical protein
MTDLTGAPAPQAIEQGFNDTALREQLSSSDWQVRAAAQERWSAKFRQSYGDEPMGQAPGVDGTLLPPPAAGEPLASPYYANEPGDLPPGPRHYPVPPQFRDAPELVGLLQGWAHEAQITIPEFSAVTEVLVRMDTSGYDRWPDHVKGARAKAVLESFQSTYENYQVLSKAQAVFGEIKRSHPVLARVLDEAGASSDAEFIHALSKLYRGA